MNEKPREGEERNQVLNKSKEEFEVGLGVILIWERSSKKYLYLYQLWPILR